MRIFVFEYITGGGMLDSPLPPSLTEEGDMMLSALVADLLELEGVEVISTRDARLQTPDLRAEFRQLHSPDDFSLAWDECIESADAVWPVAPEQFQILERICEAVVAKGKILLNSPPPAVRIAASKIGTAVLLEKQGIPVVPTYRFEDGVPDRKGSWILKPDDGIGCMDTVICRSREELFRQYEALSFDRNHVIQPFVHGTPTSLSILAHAGEAHVLSINRQRIAVTDNSFALLGCVVNDYLEEQARFHETGRKVVAAIPELWGIIGVDILDTDDGLRVLEVNPRITTSYVGLKESIGANPAGLLLDLLKGKSPRPELLQAAKRVDVDLEYAGAA